MKILRRVCIGFVALGALLLFMPRDAGFDTLPFPGAGLTVKMLAEVKTRGDYYLRVSMPKADQALGLGAETIPCSMTVSIKREGESPIQEEVTSFSRYSEFGFGKIQHYRGAGAWHLAPGEYSIEVTSRGPCDTAMSRGATLSLEQEVTHLKERYLATIVRYWSGIVFLSVGLVGLVVLEFTKA